MRQKFHLSAHNYEWNLERMSSSSQSRTSALERITQGSHATYYSLMFFIEKGQVHVFARLVKIVSYSSCRTSAIFKYFCPDKFDHTYWYNKYRTVRGLRYMCLNYDVFLSLKIVLILANSAGPDEMPHYVAFRLGHHCLPKYMFRGSQYNKG